VGRPVSLGQASMAQQWGLDRALRCASSDEFVRIRRRLSPPQQPVVKLQARRTSALISISRARLTPVPVAPRESSIYHRGRNFRHAVSGSIDSAHTCSFSDPFPDESHRPRHTIRNLVVFSIASSLLQQWGSRIGRCLCGLSVDDVDQIVALSLEGIAECQILEDPNRNTNARDNCTSQGFLIICLACSLKSFQAVI